MVPKGEVGDDAAYAAYTGKVGKTAKYTALPRRSGDVARAPGGEVAPPVGGGQRRDGDRTAGQRGARAQQGRRLLHALRQHGEPGRLVQDTPPAQGRGAAAEASVGERGEGAEASSKNIFINIKIFAYL